MGELKQVAETQAEISLVDRVKDLSNQVTLAGFGVVAKVEEVIAKVEEEGQKQYDKFLAAVKQHVANKPLLTKKSFWLRLVLSKH